AREHHFAHVLLLPRSLSFPIAEKPALAGSAVLFNDFYGALPPLDLCGVEFSEIEQPPLHHPIPANPRAFCQIIINMFLPIFASDLPLQEHAAIFSSPRLSRLRVGSAHTASPRSPLNILSVNHP